MGKEILFPRRSFLAVVGDDDTFWICRTAQIVYKDKKSFDIQWLEEVRDIYGQRLKKRDQLFY